MAELADALDLGSSVPDVKVQVLSGAPRQSKLYIACSDFLYKNQSSLIPLLFLFRKKARSVLLFGCKRPHNGSLSLPPFYDIYYFRLSLLLLVQMCCIDDNPLSLPYCRNVCSFPNIGTDF